MAPHKKVQERTRARGTRVFSVVCRKALLLTAIAALPVAGQEKLDYGRDVRPILSENCFHCHGQDSKKRMAGLRLDTYEGAVATRGNRAALVPGNLEASGIHQRITAENPARRMPPPHSNRTLTKEQIATLDRWILEGGQYSKHWAFVPPVRPSVPAVSNASWVRQPIDAFVLRRLEAEKLTPSPEAPPEKWLRRVSLDLTGLPPSPRELDAFAKDVKSRGEAAYTAAVDRLLASPAYGERMAMDWLDVARYADTHGFNNDAERSMWRWRDWVIESFNRNMPYDRFLTEQLAGDLLPNPSLEQRIATGFNRNHVINSEGGIIEEEYRVEYVSDRVRTLGMSWLGLTLECARCHDHKFDPISQRDYYRFFAFFNNVPEAGEDGRVANAVPMMPAPTREQQRELARLESAIAAESKKLDGRSRSWKWRDKMAAEVARVASASAFPSDPALRLQCGSEEFHSCTVTSPDTKPETPKPGVGISKRRPLSFSAWLNPSAADRDAPLLSAMNFSEPKASVSYGRGIEFRLVDGELEFRLGDRFPAYSVRVRSEGANLASGQWRHVALVYSGIGERDTMRVHASWVRMFADGRELPTRVLNDGSMLPGAKGDKPSPTRFRIGWDNSPETVRYMGQLNEVALWTRALADAEILAAFRHQALPYAVARQRDGKASAVETGWLRDAFVDRTELEKLRSQWLALRRSLPTVMVMEEMEQPRETHILTRGAYNAPGEKVEPGVPEELLGPWPEGAPKNRLGLARWLTSPDHPLTARVVVNRFWQQIFGLGLVKTSDNFGLQGEWPSHPELLDWLAREFIESGWDVKALMKRIVLSSTYRQDSNASRDLIARDPENRLLARGPRIRLPAEIIRDQALLISGLLKQKVGGPSVFPYQPKDLYKGIVVAADYPGTKYVESTGDDLYRRSLYTFWKRTVPHPTMTVFDAPDREFCIVRRSVTNTPLQALTLLNDPIFLEAARKLAERAVREGGASTEERLAFAFRTATGRRPDDTEMRILGTKLDEMLAAYRADEKGAAGFVTVGASTVDSSIPVPELAAWTAVANMILNLDEVITKG